jgi:hypothetical protein
MKKIIFWIVASVVLMIGFPWLTVLISGDAGMAICLVLFLAVNPIFSGFCGAAAGKDVKKFWMLPVLTAVFFLAGAWIFFEMGEPFFIAYAACYLMIGIITMLTRGFLKSKKK